MPKTLIGHTFLSQFYVEEFSVLTPLGELYRATDLRNNNSLALTLFPASLSENSDSLNELERRSVLLKVISHPNLIPFLGLYRTPTQAFTLEAWTDGPSLSQILSRAPISVNEILVYTKAICGALEAIHKQNYLHLNVSPEMIRVNRLGEITLSGRALSQPFGTTVRRALTKSPPLCFAPEQFAEEPLTPAADIYALAVLLYMLGTGKWLNGKSVPTSNEAIRKVHLEPSHPAPIALNPSLPDHFSRMILWALRKKTEERLKSTTEILSSLALAAQVRADQVALRADMPSAPVTAEILGNWAFLPPPKQALLTKDLPSLEERLGTIAGTPPKNKKRPIAYAPLLVFTLIAGFLSLFWIVRPAAISLNIPPVFTPFAADYTPPPTASPLPRATEPNGGRIAFTCTRGDYNQLCMINRDGTGLSQLTDMDASNYYPVFSPDGASLLFSSNRNGSFDLYLLSFGQKLLFQVTKNVGNVVSPDYSPDGRYIVFANRASDGPTSIWMVNADGLNPHLVYAGTDSIVATAWSPDGLKIAYAMSVGIPQEYEIFTMDANGKNHLRISQGLRGIGGSVDWSPDGKSLLVSAGAFGDKDIFKMDALTGRASPLTHGGNNAAASYSPDGQYIVFNSLRNNDQADIYIMRANGENQVQLTNNPEPDWGPHWVQ